MRFRITLITQQRSAVIPVNYQYPASAAIYKIIDRADGDYAAFLHEQGYRQEGSLKSFKLFTFSDIHTPFKIVGDRLHLLTQQAELEVCFHLPQAAENFIKGLFMQQQLDIADKKSKASFTVQSIESLPNPLQQYSEQEIISIFLKPLSPMISGLIIERKNYLFLEPGDPRFSEQLVYNWRSKIAACYNPATAEGTLLMMEIAAMKSPAKSRLITIKAGSPKETKIRGWMNFELKATGEKRFVELLLNAGAGAYNAQGCGCVEIVF